MRRIFSEGLMSAAALVILLLTLVAVDDRVREQISMRLFGGRMAQAELAHAGNQMTGIATVVYGAVREQSLEHAPLMLFVLAATVLTVFMLRT